MEKINRKELLKELKLLIEHATQRWNEDDGVVIYLKQSITMLKNDEKEIEKLKKDLEEREILGLQILYKEIGAERDQFLKGLQDIKKHIETIMPNTKEMSMAWKIANKALTNPVKVKKDVCPYCGGSGRRYVVSKDAVEDYETICYECAGTGLAKDKKDVQS